MSEACGAPELSSVTEPQWAEARRCMAVIMKVSKLPHRTRSDVRAAATELGYSCAQVYRWLKRYAHDPRLTSLLPRKRGPAPGLLRLSTQINETVDEAIETMYLTRQRPRLIGLVGEIRRRCASVGLTAPSRKAISARLRLKPRREVLSRREGVKTARDRFAPVIGSLESRWPLALVQIDHTPVDVIVVDSVTRTPIQTVKARPASACRRFRGLVH